MSSIFIRNLDIIIDMLNLINGNTNDKTYYTFKYFIESQILITYDVNDKPINLDNIKHILNFITDIHDDCIEFFKYYEQKFNSIQQKLDNTKIENIQKIYIDKYIDKYKKKIDICKNILDEIKNNKFIIQDSEIKSKLSQQNLENLNTTLKEKLTLLQSS